ncbi:MAG: NAD(P)-dependent oxidoreductase [Ferrovibrio sp.]|uniref:NAD(P)-dependent oxidoreductase n=1 Tax=Ferrovibrio sp. TaxID=1917215 RepID=UPI00391C3A41
MKKSVALYYRTLKYQPENLATLSREFDLITLDSPELDNSEVLARTEVLFAPLGFMVDANKIDACPHLKVIISNTTGHPHIDVDYAHSKGIYVACLKFAQDFLNKITPTAEHTWGLLLALTRNLVPAHRAALAGMWDRRPFGGRAMLSSLDLGIIGHGRLGTMVARYGKAFGMKVRYYDPYVSESCEGAERIDTLASLVAQSDVVTVHVPHEKETEGMISADIFKHFRHGSYLINTARGELIDWNALLEALQKGHLSGAALDVFDGEFAPNFVERYTSHPLLLYARKHDNLIITPHIGGSTVDAWRLTESHVIDMALGYLRSL